MVFHLLPVFIFALMMFFSDLIWMLLTCKKTQFDTSMNFNGGVQGSSCRSAGWHHPDPGVASGHLQGVKRLRWLLVCLGFYTTELGSPYTEVRGLSQRLVSSVESVWCVSAPATQVKTMKHSQITLVITDVFSGSLSDPVPSRASSSLSPPNSQHSHTSNKWGFSFFTGILFITPFLHILHIFSSWMMNWFWFLGQRILIF